MQNVNLTDLFLYVTKDEKAKTEVFRIISQCIQAGPAERRVTPEIIFSMIEMPESQREAESRKIKSLELVDIFLLKNSILVPDKEKIESYPSLEEAIFNLYRDNSFFPRIKELFKEQLASIKESETLAIEIKQTYEGKSPIEVKKNVIISALREAPLGTHVMWEIIYDLLHHEVRIGTLGKPVSLEGLQKMGLDLKKSVSAEKNVQPIDFLSSHQSNSYVGS
jgi:hypothetical protein